MPSEKEVISYFQPLDSMYFGVHAHQVAGEDGGFVAARAAADLDDRVFRILRVLGNQQEFDLLFEGFDLRFQFRDLPACHFAHLLVLVVGQDVFGFGQVGDGRAVAFRGSMIGSSSRYSLLNWMNCLTSAITSGSVSFWPISSYLSFRPSSLVSMELSAI